MNIERLLQVHMAALAVLGAFVLGLGMESRWAAPLIAAAAVASLAFTDLLGWFRLRRTAVEAAALLALVVTMPKLVSLGRFRSFNYFIHHYGTDQLLVLARLLLVLHVLFLFQKKDNRVYWHLLLLSFLEVVAGAGLNLQFEFGLLLMAYTLAAFATAALFFQHRCAQHMEQAAVVLPEGAARQSRAAPIAYQPAPHNFLSQRLPAWRYVRHVTVMALTTMTFTAVFFCCTPRSTLPLFRDAQQSQIGFTRDVLLDALGPLLASEQIVMRVSFQDYASRRPYAVSDEIYFRGIVLDQYVYEGGVARWLSLQSPRSVSLPPNRAPALRGLVREQIMLEPTLKPELFSVVPLLRTPETPYDLRIAVATSQISRLASSTTEADQQYVYVVATSAFRNGKQVDALPRFGRSAAERDLPPAAFDVTPLTAFSEQQHPALKALADRIVAEDAGGSRQLAVIARALERHFLVSGLYAYSLDNSLVRKAGIDPLEDFIANHRTGHCEYFASALALMLRSQGVPARLVIGFKGGEFHSRGDFHLVRDKHAHAWVEALLAPEQLPAELQADPALREHGAWLRLDPTPVSGEQRWPGLVDESIDYAQTLWRDYVLRLDSQWHRSFLQPLLEGTRLLWRLGNSRVLTLNLARWLDARQSLIQLAAGLLLAAAGLTVTIRLALQRREARRAVSRRSTNPLRRRAPAARYYRQLETLLARHGLRRPAAETPREFACWAAAALAARQTPPSTAEAIRHIVDAYYRVRYGGHTLDGSELAELQLQLARVKKALARARRDCSTR